MLFCLEWVFSGGGGRACACAGCCLQSLPQGSLACNNAPPDLGLALATRMSVTGASHGQLPLHRSRDSNGQTSTPATATTNNSPPLDGCHQHAGQSTRHTGTAGAKLQHASLQRYEECLLGPANINPLHTTTTPASRLHPLSAMFSTTVEQDIVRQQCQYT